MDVSADTNRFLLQRAGGILGEKIIDQSLGDVVTRSRRVAQSNAVLPSVLARGPRVPQVLILFHKTNVRACIQPSGFVDGSRLVLRLTVPQVDVVDSVLSLRNLDELRRHEVGNIGEQGVGAALVCVNDTASAGLVVSYVGDRAPDPAKDSVLLLAADGGRAVRALVGTAAPSRPCAMLEPAGSAAWRLDASAPLGTVAAQLFERGSYHLSGSALRYRRGAGGRQPLTPEVWSPSTGWSLTAGWAGVTFVPRDTSAGPPWSGLVAPLARP